MNFKKSYFLLPALLLMNSFWREVNAQPVSSISAIQGPQIYNRSGDIFGLRNFIENKGQFTNTLPDKDSVLFLYDYQGEKIYFTSNGLIYEFVSETPSEKQQFEALEHGREVKEAKHYFVKMNWEGGSAKSVSGQKRTHHYFTYGTAEYNSYGYKRILYQEVYKNIDIEYLIPEDKTYGIKYNIILHPGADVSQVMMRYSGDLTRMTKNAAGDMVIKTKGTDITEHAPKTFFEDGTPIASGFAEYPANVLVFKLGAINKNDRRIVIDPWVTSVNGISTNNLAYDVDYDFAGNVFIYGGDGSFKVAMYNSTGSHLWTFGGLIMTPQWNAAGYASNIAVDKFTGKCYTGQGFAVNGTKLIRLDNFGNYDNFMSIANAAYQEVWELGFQCSSADIFVFGGSTTSSLSAATISSLSAQLICTNFQPTISTGYQDIANYTIDDQGKIFIVYASGDPTLNNQMCYINAAFNGNIWTMPTGFNNLIEAGNKYQYQSGAGSSNGFNCLAVNGDYLYFYDGKNIGAYDKLVGSPVATTSIPGPIAKRQGGIAVDDCNNIYLGGNGEILIYNFNGTSFSTLTSISLGITTPTQNVQDLRFDRNTKTLYACGTDFVGTYSASVSQFCANAMGICIFNQPSLGASSTSINCATLGSATVQLNGGIGPYTYTWIPSGQTGSVVSGLFPGTYTVHVYDAGANQIFTTATTFYSSVPLSGTVMNTSLPCFSVNTGTAAVLNLTGGSGSQSYLWTSTAGTQTTAVAVGLAAGTHFVKVTDNITKCEYQQTFKVTAPPALSLTIHVNIPSVCAGKFITLTPLIAGGTLGGNGYSYSWTPFSSTPVHQATQQVGGNYVYTLTAYDAKMCPITRTVPLTFFPTPTLSVSDVSICPGQVATFNVSGANTYSWNTISGTTSYTVSPPSTTIYTVSGTGTLCSSTKTVVAVVLPVPVPTITSNSPLCNGKTLQLNAAGGVSVLWTGPQAFSSTLFQSSITQAAPNNSGLYNVTITAVNTCTAAGSVNVLVNATPAVSALGATVCVNSVLQLSGSGPVGCVYAWTGPSGFISSMQNPTINPTPLSATGDYTLVIKDQNGCQNTIQVFAKVVDLPVVSFVHNAPLCAGKTLSLNASGTTGALYYNWSGPNGFISTAQKPAIINVSVMSGGVYVLQAVSGPCSVSVAKQVQVNPLPSLVLPSLIEECEGKTIVLNPVTSPGIVSTNWVGPGGFSSGMPFLQLFASGQKHNGNYHLTITDVNGCQNFSTVVINVKLNPVISVNDVTVCLKEQALLNAEGASTYLWEGPYLESNSGSMVKVLASNSQSVSVYTVTGTANNQCSSSASLTLYTSSLPVPVILVLPSAKICLNNPISFEGNGGSKYEWTGPMSVNFNGRKFTVQLNSMGYAGVYSLTVTDNNNCKATTEQAIEISPLPVGRIASSKTEGCIPFCSDFIFTALNSSSTGRWQINNQSFSGNTFSYCFKKPGEFNVYGFLTDEVTGCNSTVEQMVKGYPIPRADFTFAPQHPLENTDVVVFTANTEDENLIGFHWTFISNDGFLSDDPATTFFFETEGTYPVSLEVDNKWQCKDTIVKTIKVEPDFLVFVPNAFTPNADELNDQFKPVTRAMKQYQLSIFDRWGQLLYKTTDVNAGWDGKYKGVDCQADVYAWIINLAALNGETKELKGHVTLHK